MDLVRSDAKSLSNATRGPDDDTGAVRYLNGRLAENHLSRRQVARWRLVRLDNKYYDRDRFKRDLETAIRKANRQSIRKAIEMAVRGRDAAAAQRLVERRDELTSPFYSGE